AQHHNVLAAQGFQALRWPTPGIDTIIEQPHIAAQRSRPLGQWTPAITTIVELLHPPSLLRCVGAPKGRRTTPVGTKAPLPLSAERLGLRRYPLPHGQWDRRAIANVSNGCINTPARTTPLRLVVHTGGYR
ncbi:MAG TPA: hypothetical protein VN306_16575, partial [Mycobacterium sp.]|nr:hypothetical protein [Mycobacterium sp.]